MPEGTGSGEQGGAVRALHERYGFETEDAMAEAFEALKTDLKAYKAAAKGKADLEAKLAALEAEKAQRAEAEMSENQKLSKRLAALEGQIAERDAAIRARDRAILMERVFGTRLSGRTAEETAVLRDLYGAAVAGQEFADEAELAEILQPVDAKFDALRAVLGGGAPAEAGGGMFAGAPGVARASAQPQGSPASAAVRDLQKLTTAQLFARARAGLMGKK